MKKKLKKQLEFNEKARQSLLTGVTKIAKAVKTTLGPRGRNVIIDDNERGPASTKDGVSVAREIELEDPYENVGAQMIKQVAEKSNDDAGDGTTTATVLAESIYAQGIKKITNGNSPTVLRNHIDDIVRGLVTELQSMAVVVGENLELIKHVATISANGDVKLATLITDAIERVGKEGTITIERGASIDSTLRVVEGMQYGTGWLSPMFGAIDPNGENGEEALAWQYEQARILVVEDKIDNINSILPLIQTIKDEIPLLIIAETVEGSALSTIVANVLRNNLKVCAVKAPYFAEKRFESMEDIAIATGATFITKNMGIRLESITLDHLGTADIKVTQTQTTILNGKCDPQKKAERTLLIKKTLANATSEYDTRRHQDRLSKMANGVAIIGIGGATEIEMRETAARVEDALHATRAAIEEGIVPGGGTALVRAWANYSKLSYDTTNIDLQLARDIMGRAVEQPLRTIISNAGTDQDDVIGTVLHKIKTSNDVSGYNARTSVYIDDMINGGVIDPLKVTRSALQNSASIAGVLLTTECIITDIPGQDTSMSLEDLMAQGGGQM